MHSDLVKAIDEGMASASPCGCHDLLLPQVLFYTRMLSDIVGRMLPRKKALAVTNPVILLGLSSGLLVASVAFFTYLQVGHGWLMYGCLCCFPQTVGNRVYIGKVSEILVALRQWCSPCVGV